MTGARPARHLLDWAMPRFLMTAPTDQPAEAPPPPTLGQNVQMQVAEVLATWAVHRAMTVGYRAITGHPAPSARDRSVSTRHIVGWAAATAVAVTVVNVVVDRAVMRPPAA